MIRGNLKNMDQHNPVYAFDDQEESLVKDRSNRAGPMSRERETNDNTQRGLQRNTAHDHEPTTLVINSERKSKKTYFITIIVAVFLFLLALALIAVVVYAPLANNLNKESSDFQAEFQRLKLQINQSQVEIHMSINSLKLDMHDKIRQLKLYQEGNATQLNALTATHAAFQDTVNNRLTGLQSVVNSVNGVQHTTTTQLHEVQSSMDTLRSWLNNATSQLNSLRSTWNSHVAAMAHSTGQPSDCSERSKHSSTQYHLSPEQPSVFSKHSDHSSQLSCEPIPELHSRDKELYDFNIRQ